ncbi:MAG: T9SS type A sorting domain-containing protein [Bacteroidales bacterium]|nr:T9SS type A sorting domain-containing protein [Bacteroidales bacterium]
MKNAIPLFRKMTFYITICLMYSVPLTSQTLNHPESVCFDAANNRYLVSNYGNGKILETYDMGNSYEIFAEGLNECLGIHLLEQTLFVSCNKYIKGFDLQTGEVIFNMYLPAIAWLDGITSDTSGYLYVVDAGGKIFKVDTENQSYTVFVSSGFPQYLQDVVFDNSNNRLLAVAWAVNAPIHAIDLADSSLYIATQTNLGLFDGITMDQFNNVYVSTHNGGKIYKFESTLAEPPVEVSGGYQEPAGLYYNQQDNILAVADYGGNIVEFIQITVGIGKKPNQNTDGLFNIYPNPAKSTLKVSYYVDRKTSVEIKLFDSNGNSIATLFIGEKQVGVHEHFWDSNNSYYKNLSPGIYFCTLKKNNKISSKKFVIF